MSPWKVFNTPVTEQMCLNVSGTQPLWEMDVPLVLSEGPVVLQRGSSAVSLSPLRFIVIVHTPPENVTFFSSVDPFYVISEIGVSV